MSYKAPEFSVADRLCREIEGFLSECGGPYNPIKSAVVDNILHAIATGYFVYKKDHYFASWWCVRAEDIEDIKARIRPHDIVFGKVMYVTEAGVISGMRDMVRQMRKRAKGLKRCFWHRVMKDDIVFDSPRQKGGA